MTRSHIYRPIQDTAGNLITDATVTVYQPSSTIPITDLLYVDSTSADTRTNGFTADTGIVDFYLDVAQVVRIGIARTGVAEVFMEDIPVGYPVPTSSDEAWMANSIPWDPNPIGYLNLIDGTFQGAAPSAPYITVTMTPNNDSFDSTNRVTLDCVNGTFEDWTAGTGSNQWLACYKLYVSSLNNGLAAAREPRSTDSGDIPSWGSYGSPYLVDTSATDGAITSFHLLNSIGAGGGPYTTPVGDPAFQGLAIAPAADGLGTWTTRFAVIDVGLYDVSTLPGQGNIASGLHAHAEGENSTAAGVGSHAEGTDSHANGDYSHAEGSGTDAEGLHSHAEGYNSNTTAPGQAAHAEGYRTTAGGIGAHSEGNLTDASGADAHAEGISTQASGDHSHAEGHGSIASGDDSHAEGLGSVASGNHSHAQGNFGQAIGPGAHAQGTDTMAIGQYSHAAGWSCIAFRDNEVAQGVPAGSNTLQRSRVPLSGNWGVDNVNVGSQADPATIAVHNGYFEGKVTLYSQNLADKWEIQFYGHNDAAGWATRGSGTVTIISSSGGGATVYGSSPITWTVTGDSAGNVVITPSATTGGSAGDLQHRWGHLDITELHEYTTTP